MTLTRLALCLALWICAWSAGAADPLRVFIRAGAKTHGPNQHDHPRFLNEWKPLLQERGLQVDGALQFPNAAQLLQTDVLVIYAPDGMNIIGAERERFEDFLRGGGGLVVIHDGVVSADQHEWAKKVQGGAWRWDGETRTKWKEDQVGLYIVHPEHSITRDLSNFFWKDEIYYDMDMAEDARVLATSFESVFIIAPQLWTYEKTWEGGARPYRAFVSLPGHEYDVFNTPHYRAVLLRGIAWAGGVTDTDAYCRPEELASLRYPAGGPTPPDRAHELIEVHPEFDLSLVASEPLIQKVISLDWDPAGRLWVAETPEYPGGRTINSNDRLIAGWNVRHPEGRPPGDKEDRPAMDRICWIEDTDGDGRMDRKQVFFDGLELVTSLVFHKDGVIVAQAPDILHLRDTDGDGRADQVDALYTGFGTFDTHAVLNNFRWGLDGWIYSAIGYSAGNPSSGDRTRDFGRVTAGVIRFKPDGSALEQYASGSCNTWGFDVAPDGELFYTTATCGEHFLHIVLPESALARGSTGGVRASAVTPDHQNVFPAVVREDPPYRQIDWVGMFTAAAGSCFYNGGAWPERFDGSHFLSETTVNLVHQEFLTPRGSTYVARKEPGREETEFIRSSDLWFRPVHARVGPDGALYVVDFYNQAAIHNDTRGPDHGARGAATRPDRDHYFGRLWRVQHREARSLARPDLTRDDAALRVAALSHPNGWVRLTAHRLLTEQGAGAALDSLRALARQGPSSLGRMHALHVLENLGQLDDDTLLAAFQAEDSVVRKNTLRIVAQRNSGPADKTLNAVLDRLDDTDPRARIQALLALALTDASPDVARAVVAAWPELGDDWLRTAALGVAAQDPLRFIEAALATPDPALASFVRGAARLLAQRGGAGDAARLVVLLGASPAATDALKRAALESLGAELRADTVPPWNAELQSAFVSLLQSPDAAVAGAALPLIGRWDRQASMSEDLKPFIERLSRQVEDPSLPDDLRAQVAVNLVGVRQMDDGIVPRVGGLLGSGASAALQQRVLEALGASGDPDAVPILIRSFDQVPAGLRDALFAQLIKRASWADQLVDALAARTISLTALGPPNIHRLRTYADEAVAQKAGRVIDELRGPMLQQKDALVAALLPEVQKPGDAAKGHESFTANCASCHVFKDEGRNLAPNLTGMGAHGAADLLVHIIDPNRLVEPNFLTFSIETKDDESYDGIIQNENRREILLRNASGDYTIQQDNVASRRSTGLSLMPEGFEALGADGLRDLLTYLTSEESRFRFIDLQGAFTADSTRGIYAAPERDQESVVFREFGPVKVGDVPFDILHPSKSANGNNVIVLRAHNGMARRYPQRVEVKGLNLAASRLHVLGAVGGWAWPFGGDEYKGLPVARITVRHANEALQSWTLTNGVHVADYNGRTDVPGSQPAPGLVRHGQLRTLVLDVDPASPVTGIAIESFNNAVAPTFVAVTAELAGAGLPTTPAGLQSEGL